MSKGGSVGAGPELPTCCSLGLDGGLVAKAGRQLLGPPAQPRPSPSPEVQPLRTRLLMLPRHPHYLRHLVSVSLWVPSVSVCSPFVSVSVSLSLCLCRSCSLCLFPFLYLPVSPLNLCLSPSYTHSQERQILKVYPTPCCIYPTVTQISSVCPHSLSLHHTCSPTLSQPPPLSSPHRHPFSAQTHTLSSSHRDAQYLSLSHGMTTQSHEQPVLNTQFPTVPQSHVLSKCHTVPVSPSVLHHHQ